jgi:hypothetical protein
MAALHFFSHGSYQKSIGKDQHCSFLNLQSVTAVTVTIRLLTLSLDIWEIGKCVKFPRTPEEIITIQTGYLKNYNFPGVIGCIDGTFVSIVPPPANHPLYLGNLFINRNNFHALNILIVCIFIFLYFSSDVKVNF